MPLISAGRSCGNRELLRLDLDLLNFTPFWRFTRQAINSPCAISNRGSFQQAAQIVCGSWMQLLIQPWCTRFRRVAMANIKI